MAVGINAVSKDLTAKWDEIQGLQEFIAQFVYVFVAAADGPERDEIVEELQKRVTVPLLVADKASFRGNRSVAELMKNAGYKAVQELLFGAIEIPRPGLLDLAYVDVTEQMQARTMSGFVPLDYCVGGFRAGELSVWTGRRGEGKSTLLGQLLVEAVNQSKIVCAYSGELPARRFKRALLPQIAGPQHLVSIPDPQTGRTVYVPDKESMSAIDRWLEGRFLLTDIRQADAHDEDTILSLFEYAQRKYGCSVYLVDNIMTARLKGERELGHYDAQKAFTQRLSAFAKRYGAHVHMVAHPRKAGDGALSADDVAGANEITNLADNVFSVERTGDNDEFASRIRLLKVRETGSREVVPLDFDEKTCRYYDKGGNPNKKYSWEAMENGHG